MGYRISTAIFALLFASMVLKDLTRPEMGSVPREPASGAETSFAPPVVPSGEDAVPEPDETGGDPAADPNEPTLDLAIRLLTGKRSRYRRSTKTEQLRSRADEVIPILEDWLRRREELWRRGIELYGVPWAYAELAGARAVPLFEELLKEDSDRWANTHLEALTRIDDPLAVAAMRRYHEELSANATHIKADYLWAGAPGFRDLLKEWAKASPTHLPELKDRCLWAWFRAGTMEDREEAWPVVEEMQRLRVLAGNAAWTWPSPWPERFEAAARAELSSEDPKRRYRGIFHVLGKVDRGSPELVVHAERVLEEEIEASAGRREDAEPSHEEFVELKKKREEQQVEREAAKRRRDLLAPR